MKWRRWLLLPLILALAAGLGYTVLFLPDQAQGLQGAVADQLEKSGVTNPVTAVLLNFRGYDTLLEMMVLLLALLGVWSLGAQPVVRTESNPGPVLDILTRLLVPVLVLVAAYLLWAGAHAPGGAFQAGAVLGAAGVLWILTFGQLQHGLSRLPLRIALVAGVATFMAIAALVLQTGRQLLEYPPAQAGSLILLIEALATVSIGVTLAMLFLGTEPTDKD
jgi:multisubunit Na+/H+ antiporter MnhB subunit